MENDPVKALQKVLDLERTALVEGDLERMDGMMPEKEKLIGAINQLQVLESADLIVLHRKLERNQALLNSAAEGIRAVTERMAELRRVRQEFSTYDATGHRSGYPMRSAVKLERRA